MRKAETYSAESGIEWQPCTSVKFRLPIVGVSYFVRIFASFFPRFSIKKIDRSETVKLHNKTAIIMPRSRSPKTLQDFCAEAVAANLDKVSWGRPSSPGDSQDDQLQNPFEILRMFVKHYSVTFSSLFGL